MAKATVRSVQVGRNDECPCGSGRKYKHCCARKAGGMTTGGRVLLAFVIVVAVVGVVLALTNRSEPASVTGKVWSPEHGHYHVP